MGVRNLRAICPNCGGKIHTQPKGLGHFTWANSWMLVQTGTECQHCGVALSGKVAAGNKAILAEDADKTWFERETGASPKAKAPQGPRLSSEQEKAAVVARTYPVPPDALYSAVEQAVVRLGHKSAADNVQKVLAAREERRLAFKTRMTIRGGAQSMEARVEENEMGATVHLTRHGAMQVFDWGEKNRLTSEFFGAVETELARTPAA